MKKFKYFFNRKSEVIIIVAFMIVLMIVSTIMESRFFTWYNLYSLLRGGIPLTFLAFGQCLIMTAVGGVDLSVAGMVSAINCYMAQYATTNTGWVLPLIITILIGLGGGLVNGLMVTKGKLQPLIATLALNLILGGVAHQVYPTEASMRNTDMIRGFYDFMTYGVGGFFPLIFLAGITAALVIFLYHTRTGRAFVATGGNEYSAKCSNINTDRIKILAFMLSGLLAATAGMYTTCQSMAGQPSSGDPLVTKSIIAAVIGGTSMAGGRGSIIGCVVGVYVLNIINNILNMMGFNFYYQYLIQGLLLVIALAMAALKSRKPLA